MCGAKVEYLRNGRELNCHLCGKNELAHVHCALGHYVCENCHGERFLRPIRSFITLAEGDNPLLLAEGMLNKIPLPMLGCEHAWIAVAALMVALKNHGPLNITNEMIEEALSRTRKQAIGAYCGLTGICGMAPAMGSVFSVILGASCPGDVETSTTMRAVSRVIEAIAAETGPCCCKNFLRTALLTAAEILRETMEIDLPTEAEIYCVDSDRHPHGCREARCRYYWKHAPMG